MDINQQDSHIGGKSGIAAALMVFCVFTVSVLTVLIMGVGAYNSITDASRESYDATAVSAFLWTKTKNYDEAGRVYAGEFHGIPALYVEEEFSGVTYLTVIYQYEGFLREIFFEQGYQHIPEQGIPVLASDAVLFENLGGGMIKATTDSGEVFLTRLGG